MTEEDDGGRRPAVVLFLGTWEGAGTGPRPDEFFAH